MLQYCPRRGILRHSIFPNYLQNISDTNTNYNIARPDQRSHSYLTNKIYPIETCLLHLVVRYDTLFYVACLDQTPRVVLDQSEVVTLRWTTPLSILEEYSAGAVFLAPPQVYEMSRLASIPSYAHLARFAREREFLGVDRWLPVIGAASDGVVSLLPGIFGRAV